MLVGLLKSAGLVAGAALLCMASPGAAQAQARNTFDGAKALAYTTAFVKETGPRFNGSPGLAKAQAMLKKYFAKDDLVEDTFLSSTPPGRR